ncbi:MAG: type II toxin-antitoxin system RelE/ParE family toxin [Bacilli bacterium]|nr:type II toxin-antitoxin system RelE/ParE family toxin [Bacilli bacterium]
MYHVEFIKSVKKSFSKLDKYTQTMILNWIEKNLEGCDNPRSFGKPLSGDRKGQWRYRVGDYRIITLIQDNKLIILVIAIGHRRDIYKK